MEGGEGELVSDMPARSFASRHSERIMSCLMGFFLAGNSPVRHWKGVTREGRRERRSCSCCPVGLPISGTASEVVGMMAERRFIKTVSERRTVTSERGGRAMRSSPVGGRLI